MTSMPGARGLVVLGALLAGNAWAQTTGDEPVWKDGSPAVPPAFDARRVVPLEMPRGLTLTVGVDPDTISITPDGVVRYVVVTSNAGAVMGVMYEGLHCATRSNRVYARYTPDGAWTSHPDAPWRDNSETPGSRHALAFARTAACKGTSPNDSVRSIVHALRFPVKTGNL